MPKSNPSNRFISKKPDFIYIKEDINIYKL